MKTLLLFGGFLLLFSCNTGSNDHYLAVNTDTDVRESDPEHPGKALIEQYCYACHSPSAPHDERLGPPMIAIKKHYISEDSSKESFTNDMISWLEDPSEERSKMPGAVRRFGVMPKQKFPEDVIRKIADYMFEYEIEQPDWFEDHFREMQGQGHGKGQGMKHGRGQGMGHGQGQGFGKGKDETNQKNKADKDPGTIGLRIARTTKAELGKNLMQAINRKGTAQALEFCNTRAYPITDSMATVHNALIKRVSDKPRNPLNNATAAEVSYIEEYKVQLANGEEPQPMILTKGEVSTFYYPIVTNTLCMQCHGEAGTDILPETLSAIEELYPEDKATGYSENMVRGMWRIQFKESN